MIKKSFPPIADNNITTLILGSLPGDRSLTAQQYYAHPQNRFWKVMENLFDATPPSSYSERVSLLLTHHIGLWDVCAEAFRHGSMDLDIKSEIPNDLPTFLQNYPQVRRIVFNGQKARAVFRKYFTEQDGIEYLTLPSTSPANARLSLATLTTAWRILTNRQFQQNLI